MDVVLYAALEILYTCRYAYCECSANDFINTLQSFKKESVKLSNANKEAERRLALTKLATQSFNDVMQAYANRMKFMASCSVPRRRWITSCRRVIIQNTVKALTARVNKMKFPTKVGGEVFASSNFLDIAPVDVGLSKPMGKKVTLAPILAESAEDPSSATATPTGCLSPRAESPVVGGITSNSGGMLEIPMVSNASQTATATPRSAGRATRSKAKANSTLVSKSSSLLPAIKK